MNFNISRIHTQQGIFQLSGKALEKQINIEKLFMMGSDGWFELDLSQEKVQLLLTLIKTELLVHLNQ